VQRALHDKRPTKETVVLQYNALPDIARLTSETIAKNGWEVVWHPQLVQSGLGDFDPMRGERYENDDAVQEVVRGCLRGSGTDFCRSGILKLMQRWQKCKEVSGDFIEK
jgi:hypothetical protein